MNNKIAVIETTMLATLTVIFTLVTVSFIAWTVWMAIVIQLVKPV